MRKMPLPDFYVPHFQATSKSDAAGAKRTLKFAPAQTRPDAGIFLIRSVAQISLIRGGHIVQAWGRCR